MQTTKIVVLFLSFFTIGVASHRLLLQHETDLPTQTLESGKLFEEAEARQQILAELEQVHQLRERMLQAASTYTSSGPAPAPAPAASLASSECLHDHALACSTEQSPTPDTATGSSGAVTGAVG